MVRYVQLPADEVDTQLLQDAARKEALQQKQWRFNTDIMEAGREGGWEGGIWKMF